MTVRPTLLLALETSARGGSVALLRSGASLEVAELSADRRHASELLPTIHGILSRHGASPRDVDGLAFSAGPGSFTGIRVAATIARVFHAISAAGVARVPTAEVLALEALEATGVAAVLLDAKLERAYCTAYRIENAPVSPSLSLLERANQIELLDPGASREPLAWLQQFRERAHSASPVTAVVVGSVELREQIAKLAPHVRLVEQRPAALAVAAIGMRMLEQGLASSAAEILPIYGRGPECEEVYDQRRAAAIARRAENSPP